MARAFSLTGIVAAAVFAGEVRGQSLEERVDAAPAGLVRMSFEARADVCKRSPGLSRQLPAAAITAGRIASSAFFWLAESEDERAIDLFEEVLTR